MPDKRWGAFKSGSDIRGFGMVCENDSLYLSDEVISQITLGFAIWLRNNTSIGYEELHISVGHDSRLSAERIKKQVIITLSGLGINILDCGLSSTPAMFMTTVDLNCNGAVQITASHHPYDRNGFKFYTRIGGLAGKNIDEVLDYAQNERAVLSERPGSIETVNYMNTYTANLRDMICREVNNTDYFRPLRGFKIVVDAGNGVGGFYANKVLEPLGADITGSQFLEPDGAFPNHLPNPENEEAMDSVSSAVIKNEADFGVIFDTDVDRAGCVGKGGLEINRNRLIALAAAITLENNEGALIVTDSTTSDGLTRFIKEKGGVHLRYKRGYKNVIDKQIELSESGINCPLAIETSGHAAFRDNYFLDDGAYLITKIIIKMAILGKKGESVYDLISSLEEPLEESEIRIGISSEDYKNYGDRVIEHFEKFAERKAGWRVAQENYEGVRISTDENSGSGWIILRMSVHDPVLVINAESEISGGVKIMLIGMLEAINRFDELDFSGLAHIIEGK